MSRCFAALCALLAICPVAAAQSDASSPVTDAPLEAPAPVVLFDPVVLDSLESVACASCHLDVAREWAGSAHGLAWVDVEYQDAISERRRPEQCHACHIPEPLLLSGSLPARPVARAVELHLGVSCETCHLGPDGAMLGPRGTPTSAHPSAASALLTGSGSNALCTVCHATNIGPVVGVAKDFKGSSHEARGASCVGCHMHSVERRWATAGPGDEPPPLRIGRSHAIQTPRDPTFLARAFHLELVDDHRLRVENRAGHRVPGMIGRRIEFRVELSDAGGGLVGEAKLVLDSRRYLPVEGSKDIEWSSMGTQVHVVGLHWDPRSEEPVTFLDEVFSTDG